MVAIGIAIFFALDYASSGSPNTSAESYVETVYDDYIDDEYNDDSYSDDGYYDDEYYEDEPYYYQRVSGYTLGEIEEAMYQYLDYSEDLTPYIIPGYKSIIDRIIELEYELSYDNYAEWFSQGSFNQFNDICSSYTYGAFWAGYGCYYNTFTDLSEIDNDYQNSTGTGLFDIVEQAFSEHYGDNLTLHKLSVMEVEFVAEYENFILRVFLIETDTGYFLLFDY